MIKKILATILILTFSIQQLAFAYVPEPEHSTLATNKLGDKIILPEEIPAFVADIAAFIQERFPLHQQQRELDAWVAGHKETAREVLIERATRTEDGFLFIVTAKHAKPDGTRDFYVSIFESTPPGEGTVTMMAEGDRSVPEVYESVQWATAEQALARVRLLAPKGSKKTIYVSSPLETTPGKLAHPVAPYILHGWNPPSFLSEDLHSEAALKQLAGLAARPGTKWAVLENKEADCVLLVAESLRSSQPGSVAYSTPHFLHYLIGEEGWQGVPVQNARAFTVPGHANRAYISENLGFLRTFFEHVKGQDGPVLLRVPVECFVGLTREEITEWLITLNGAENVFIELYTGLPGKVVTQKTYAAVGLAALYEKNQRLETLEFESSRQNTVTLLMVTRKTSANTFSELIEKEEVVRNSMVVPIGQPAIGEKETPFGDSTGLIRGALFGFQLIHIARHPDDTKLKERTRNLYESLMRLQGVTDFALTVSDIEALIGADPAERAAALKKLAAGLPEETAIPIKERMEIFKHSEIVGRSA